jgi:hypothetical protein
MVGLHAMPISIEFTVLRMRTNCILLILVHIGSLSQFRPITLYDRVKPKHERRR